MSLIRVYRLLLLLLINLLFVWRTVVCDDHEGFSTRNNESNLTDEMCVNGLCDKTVIPPASAGDGASSSTTVMSNEASNSLLNQGIRNFTATADIIWDEISENPLCPVNVPCNHLDAECIHCDFNFSCVYGQTLNVTCRAMQNCEGSKEFERQMTCRYCYQTPLDQHTCAQMGYCNTVANPVQRYRSNCTVKADVLCLGNRKFLKNLRCNWTSGYRWSTTLILSITLGGFGADRFYLGHWQEGIGKLFSFGGAGVWTLIDVILVAVGYLKPADGSLYI